MTDLYRKAFVGFLRLLAIQAACIFIPAWTLDYWQAWLFLAVFYASIAAITAYLLKYDPELLERRITAGPGSEKETSQKIIQSLAAVSLIVMFIVPAVDHRLAWSAVSPQVAVAGDAMVALGFLLVFFVFRENTFTSAIIAVDAGQKVVSTGPYALVRHPYYGASLVMLAGMPLALGSWWGLLTIIPMTLLIVWRIVEEERYLVANLEGYAAYRNTVRYRLLPFVW
jgi:protein-S-isoprenylcysteine O-methyltransferase Ste14